MPETSQAEACSGEGGGQLPPWQFSLAARVRGVTRPAGWLAALAGVVDGLVALDADLPLPALFLAWCLLLVSVLTDVFTRVPSIPPQVVSLPVRGTWSAHNSPADRVPSHRTHAWGQTFAIDLVCRADYASRLAGKERSGFLAPDDFPGFGAEIRAPAPGRVVAVRDHMRDHRSRSGANAQSFLKLEGFLRGVVGGGFLVGNRIVLDLGGGRYALLAHLKRRSVRVKRGQEVCQGELLAECGNSGNSSEPHLHFQLMDHPREAIAAGLPFVFQDLANEASEGWLPRNGELIANASEGLSADRMPA